MLSKEEIRFFLTRFRNTDISNENERQRLIDSFINAVFVYTGKIVLTFNFRDGTKTVSLKDVDGSDFESSTPPRKETRESVSLSLCSSIFSITLHSSFLLVRYTLL